MRIGIIGASSQVGASVAFYLTKRSDVQVVCFARSLYGQVFFELLGIPCEQIDLSDKESTLFKLKDLDVVIDFSYPTGQFALVKPLIKTNLYSVMACLPDHAAFIYMSSIMAYGMSPTEQYIHNRMFSRSPYAHLKRYAERLVIKLGRRSNRTVYNFRLGQVHGILQSVSRSFKEKLGRGKSVWINGNPNDPTNTIFANSIAEAVVSCIMEKKPSGTYTLVSSPQWTLKELYDYYLHHYNFEATLIFVPAAIKKRQSISQRLFGYLSTYRLLIETYVLLNLPLISIKLKGKYRMNEVVSVIAKMKSKGDDTDLNLLGRPDGVIISTHSSSIVAVTQAESEFETFYNERVTESRL